MHRVSLLTNPFKRLKTVSKQGTATLWLNFGWKGNLITYPAMPNALEPTTVLKLSSALSIVVLMNEQ